MKTKLTTEQSNRLIELGVDPSKASETYVGRWEVCSTGTFADPDSCEPLFALSDILSLLPKRTDNLILSIFGTGLDELTEELEEGWMATYVSEFMESKGKDTIFQAPELIDALFELLCWCIKNKHITL